MIRLYEEHSVRELRSILYWTPSAVLEWEDSLIQQHILDDSRKRRFKWWNHPTSVECVREQYPEDVKAILYGELVCSVQESIDWSEVRSLYEWCSVFNRLKKANKEVVGLELGTLKLLPSKYQVIENESVIWRTYD